MIAKEKMIGLVLSSLLLVIYWYLGVFQSDTSIIIKLIPFIFINIYVMSKTKDNQ